MNFYLYKDEIVPEYEVPETENKESLKKITISDVDDNNKEHAIEFAFNENAIMVKVGENGSHPMNDEEYIEWIMLEIDDKIVNKINLSKNAEATAIFMIQNVPIEELKQHHAVIAYVYCNTTGMWRKKMA